MNRDPIDRPADLHQAKMLIWFALQAKEAHYKQWYLEQIGAALGIDMDWQREYAAESPELKMWERGVCPTVRRLHDEPKRYAGPEYAPHKP